MERVVYKHAYNHLVKNNLIYKYESGFFPKHSTVHQPLAPFLKIPITLAIFQLEEHLLCYKDLLNIIRRGFAIFSVEILSILLLILSKPVALFKSRI
jgi:hypothetical protein